MKGCLRAVCFSAILGLAFGLRCWTCHKAASIEDCDRNGRLEACTSFNQECQSEYRRTEYVVTVTKRCKQILACQQNQLQNAKRSGVSTQCNVDQANSVCRCCCKEDGCNLGELSCTATLGDADGACPVLPQLTDVKTSCNRGNSTGSTCSHHCTKPDYFVHPREDQKTTCQSGGSWSNPPPCCARNCPPYLLYDSVILYHANTPENSGAMLMLSTTFLQLVELGEDSIRFAGAYFSGIPLLTSRIRFRDYLNDKFDLTELVFNRIKPVNTEDGLVNVTAALEYARENLLTEEAGMRGPNVPKKITIIMDTNSNDDPTEYADLLREQGIQIVMIGFLNDNVELDVKRMERIAGSKENVFLMENNPTLLDKSSLDGVFARFCKNPCDHVLQT